MAARQAESNETNTMSLPSPLHYWSSSQPSTLGAVSTKSNTFGRNDMVELSMVGIVEVLRRLMVAYFWFDTLAISVNS